MLFIAMDRFVIGALHAGMEQKWEIHRVQYRAPTRDTLIIVGVVTIGEGASLKEQGPPRGRAGPANAPGSNQSPWTPSTFGRFWD